MTKTELEKPTAKRTTSRIPRFQTIEEEAAFWDTHSTTEFEDEFAEVSDVRFVMSRAQAKKGITVRLEEEPLARLRKEAKDMGIGLSTLVRMWILEHLKATANEAEEQRQTGHR